MKTCYQNSIPLILVLSVSLAYAGEKHKGSKDIKIDPSDVNEKCLKLKPDQVLHYSFEASRPLKFNLHYHLPDKTVFHIKEETAGMEEVFHPVKKQNVYCMEWRNAHGETVDLKYTYEIKGR